MTNRAKGNLLDHEILGGVEQGWVKPHVDGAFSFEKVSEAHQYIEDRENIAKVVLGGSTKFLCSQSLVLEAVDRIGPGGSQGLHADCEQSHC